MLGTMQDTFHTLFIGNDYHDPQSGIIKCFPSEETDPGNGKTRISRQGGLEKHSVITLLSMSLPYSPFL